MILQPSTDCRLSPSPAAAPWYCVGTAEVATVATDAVPSTAEDVDRGTTLAAVTYGVVEVPIVATLASLLEASVVEVVEVELVTGRTVVVLVERTEDEVLLLL